jgi:hypothetical protein
LPPGNLRALLIRNPDSAHWHAPQTTAYADEAELQSLIAESPSLLPGVEAGVAAVATEVEVPGVGPADVVVVSTDGEITIVECKLAANAEIRRWVIGQVFSYAAGMWQLSYDDLERAFEARSKDLTSPFDGVAGWEAPAFREVVDANLQRGSFRLVIAVDQITDELKRSVSYINRHTTAELRLLALELRHAADSGVEILLPEIYGQESAAEAPRPKRRWDEPSLIQGIREAQPPELADRMIRLYEALRDAGGRTSWGSGTKPSVTMWLGEAAGNPVSVSVYAAGSNWPGGIAINFDYVRDKRSPAEMARLAALVREVPGVAPYLEGLEEKNWGMHGGMEPARVLASEETLEAFIRTIIQAAERPRA